MRLPNQARYSCARLTAVLYGRQSPHLHSVDNKTGIVAIIGVALVKFSSDDSNVKEVQS